MQVLGLEFPPAVYLVKKYYSSNFPAILAGPVGDVSSCVQLVHKPHGTLSAVEVATGCQFLTLPLGTQMPYETSWFTCLEGGSPRASRGSLEGVTW